MNKQQLGEFIREQRIAHQLSQIELGDLAGLHYHRVIDVEKGEKNYNSDTLFAVCKALGITISCTVKSTVNKKEIYDFGIIKSDL